MSGLYGVMPGMRGAPQPVRISRAGRLFAGCQQADNRVQLVRQRHGRPGDCRFAEVRTRRRRVGFDTHRQIVKIDRLPHVFGQPLVPGVDAADGPLQLRELAHHVGRQVRLRQQRRLRRRGSGALVGAEQRSRNPSGKVLDPLRLLPVRAELLVKDQRQEPIDAGLERDPAIGFPEEPGVAQPRRHDPLGIPRDRTLVVRLGIDDGKERVLQPASSPSTGK